MTVALVALLETSVHADDAGKMRPICISNATTMIGTKSGEQPSCKQGCEVTQVYIIKDDGHTRMSRVRYSGLLCGGEARPPDTTETMQVDPLINRAAP